MSWSELSPGVFSKELDGVEKIYRYISQTFKPLGREHWGLYCVCTFELGSPFSPRDPTTALRDAWKALRHEFPSLAIRPDGLTNKKYTLPDASSVEEWVKETFIVDRTTRPEDIVASYPARDTPSLYFFPESSQILFLASHWRVDGLGTCMILERFFSLLAAATPPLPLESWTNDLHKISPSLEDALEMPTTDTPEVHELARKQIEAHHKNAVHAGGLPYRGDATTPPGHPSDTGITLSKASTAAFILACKARGFTVTSAVYAALATTYFALSPDESTQKYAAVMPVNMRRYMAPPYNGRDHAVQVYVTGRTPTVDRGSSFDEKTQQFSAYCRDWYTDDFKRAHRVATKRHFEALSRRPEVAGAPPPNPPSGVTLSSLGVIEDYLPRRYGDGAVNLTDFHFGVSMLTRQMLMYVWTFDGKLSLSVSYNDAYHDATSANGFLDFIRKTLEKEVGVALETEIN
ncbi:hypothetical protein GGR54DRAFT_96454 [Hypoxylon sp. NC1633]|nr:hypothetical protein GGR54DRAFT_96454 [Hypoxylon sp. NC1633]